MTALIILIRAVHEEAIAVQLVNERSEGLIRELGIHVSLVSCLRENG